MRLTTRQLCIEGITIIVLLYLVMLMGSMTGFLTSGVQFADTVNLSFSENASYEWTPQHIGELQSIGISGHATLQSGGYVRVSITDGNTTRIIYHAEYKPELNVQPLTLPEPSINITGAFNSVGLAVDELGEIMDEMPVDITPIEEAPIVEEPPPEETLTNETVEEQPQEIPINETVEIPAVEMPNENTTVEIPIETPMNETNVTDVIEINQTSETNETVYTGPVNETPIAEIPPEEPIIEVPLQPEVPAENITETPENITTEQPEQSETFRRECDETCRLKDFTNAENKYTLIFEVENATINVSEISYEVKKSLKPENGTAFESGEELADENGKKIGKKIVDDTEFETYFTLMIIENGTLELKFYHDSKTAQPVWIEQIDDISYILDIEHAKQFEEVSLNVTMQNGKVPRFRLHIGKDSEIFEFGITVITVQSYPTVGGNWTVEFNTTGIADLAITGYNGTVFGTDLEFLELTCGNEILNATFNGTSVIYPSYSCDQIGTETSRVITFGKHTLEFSFGDSADYAHNIAGGNLSCTVRTACEANETAVLRMYDTKDAHAEVQTESNYDYIICCIDQSGNNTIGTDPSGTVFLKLSGDTDAHVELPDQTNYATNAYVSASNGQISCTFPTSACTADYTCLATISGSTDAHIADCTTDPYDTRVCCKLAENIAPPQISLYSPANESKPVDLTPTFEWDNATDANGDTLTYQLQVDGDINFGSPVVDVASITEASPRTSYTSVSDLSETTYYWRVRAYDGTVYGDWSDIRNIYPGTPPTYTNFGGSTTNFTAVSDIRNVSQPIIENAYFGKIQWLGSVNASGANFDSYITIGSNFVSVNSNNLNPTFNTSANVTLYSIAATNPMPFWDPEGDGTFVACPSDVCTIIDNTGGNLAFSVTHFTDYIAGDNVTDCGTLTTAGYYAVTQNITDSGTCITVGANDIVLDCQGFAISGDNSGNGIDSSDYDNITIKNCIINSFETGIYILAGSGNNITNNTASSNTYGVIFDTTANNTLADNTVDLNTEDGIIISGSSGNNITNNIVNTNTRGIIFSLSSDNNLTNNTASSNGYGIYFEASTSNNLTNNVANSNTLDGIYFDSSSDGNTLASNTVNLNNNGIHFITVSSNTLTNNNATGNTLWDFYSESDSLNNTVINLATQQNLVSFTSKDISLKGLTVEEGPADPITYTNIGKYVNATNNSADSWMFLNFSYSDSDWNGTDIVRDSTLSIWKNNDTWIQSGWNGTRVLDTVNNIVGVNITTFGSTFAPMGEEPMVIVSLPTNAVDFGAVSVSNSYNTSSDSPEPFLVQNDGNIAINVTIYGTDYWQRIANPSSNYQFKCRANTSACPVGSTIDWANMPNNISPATLVANLSYVIGVNQVKSDIKITVPSDEPAGTKSSIVSIIASAA